MTAEQQLAKIRLRLVRCHRVPDDQRIGQWLRMRREKRHLSGRQLAQRVGISAMHLSHIERGLRRVSDPHLLALLRILK